MRGSSAVADARLGGTLLLSVRCRFGTVSVVTLVGSPAADLQRAQERAGVEVRSVVNPTDFATARRIFDTVWPGQCTQVQQNVLKAVIHAGGYSSVAYLGAEPVGAALAFVGRHFADGWHVHLHSHMAAVLESHRNSHIGTALKLHQRMWALDRDIDTISWTFDPLVRRNAILNILKLGVDVRGYEIDFYGQMPDAINVGDPTDRVFAWWHLSTAKVFDAVAGRLLPLDAAMLIEDGRDIRVVEIPEDIVELRKLDPAAATRWRLSLRETLTSALADGYCVIGVERTGNYVLFRERA